jgi:hypothetical protein
MARFSGQNVGEGHPIPVKWVNLNILVGFFPSNPVREESCRC